MFFKLALGNVRKSVRDYAVYFVTLALGVAVFYAFNTISGQADFLSTNASEIVGTISSIMTGTTVFLAFVLGFLMVYANNYLVKRRKRELGLYQVLGMTRGQVSSVLVLETLMASLLAFVAGIAIGLIFSQLLVFVTANFLHDRVHDFAFRVSPEAMGLTLLCFGIIFLVMLAFNLRTLRKVRLVDLMGAERRNESVRLRNLPLNVALFVAGVGLIVGAYVRLDHDGLPVGGPATLPAFGVTTLMVIAGTFLFFYSVSGFMLRVAQRFHGAYYHGLNMFTVRQLAAKINTVSISTGLISLILFFAITSVTSGLSICAMLNQNSDAGAPYDATFTAIYERGDGAGAAATHPADIAAQLKDKGYDLGPITRGSFLASSYEVSSVPGTSSMSLGDFLAVSGDEVPSVYRNRDVATFGLFMMSESDYNAVRALDGLGPVSLGSDGYVLTTDMTDLAKVYSDALAKGKTVVVNGRTLHPLQTEAISDASARFENSATAATNPGTVVVPDELLAGCTPYSTCLGISYAGDTDAADDLVRRISRARVGDLTENGAGVAFLAISSTRTDELAASLGMTGVVSYLSIYIGFVLVISCAAILAIQQLSEASDSAQRYRLLSEIGCPRSLSNRSLLVQTLVYFLAPLAVAVAHSLCAMRSVITVVRLFGALDITGVAATTAGMFLVVYGAYFLVTYSVAKGLVNAHTVEARS
ncbi:MAG: FtsX-like permease family protein [Atopobiaceae bacterium]